MAATVVSPVHAQQALRGTGDIGRELALQPRLSVKETVSNNVELSPNQPLADALTEVTGGVNFHGNSGRIKGFLDYALTGFLYARHSELNTYQNALRANLGTELVENRARVDLNAAITQSSISAFGVQPGSSGLPANNLTEYRSFSITPLLNGPLGPAVEYKAGLTYSISNARGTNVGDTTNDTAFVRLGPRSPGVLGWSVDATALRSNYAAGRQTMDNRLTGTLSRKVESLDLLVNASAGVEVSDMASLQRTRYQNWGIGATWTPSPRTKLVAQYDERFFGNGHVLAFEYRTPLTTWTISDTRTLNTNGNGTSTAGRGATFDLYYAQFASIEPDPAKRTELVNNYLKANGLSATTGTDTGYLRSGVTVLRTQSAAVAYRGIRNTAVMTFYRSVNLPLAGAPVPGEDFTGTTSIVSERVSANLSHQLTPVSSAVALVSYQQSRGDQPSQFSSQREVSLQYLSRLTERSNLAIGARRTLFKTYQAPYDEGAVFANYVMFF